MPLVFGAVAACAVDCGRNGGAVVSDVSTLGGLVAANSAAAACDGSSMSGGEAANTASAASSFDFHHAKRGTDLHPLKVKPKSVTTTIGKVVLCMASMPQN